MPLPQSSLARHIFFRTYDNSGGGQADLRLVLVEVRIVCVSGPPAPCCHNNVHGITVADLKHHSHSFRLSDIQKPQITVCLT